MKKGPSEVGGKPMLTATVPLGVETNSPYFESFNFVGKIIGPKVLPLSSLDKNNIRYLL